MKTVSGIVMFVLLGSVAYAQQAPSKAITEIAVSNEKMVRNAPFSADAISESVQTLSDGNRIVRSSTSKLYRNSEGRFRREMSGGSGVGGLGSLYTIGGQGVTILDPVGGFRYTLDDNLRTARAITITPKSELKVYSGIDEKVKAELKAAATDGTTSAETRQFSEKLKAEIKAAVAAAPAIAATAVTGQVMEALAPLAMPTTIGSRSKWETRTEELGTQNIEGVDAEGTRTVTTIPAGAIGNERAIEITYEKWYSRELQLVVLSKHNDPRFGEQTYRLTNIHRSEPDPSLFAVPNGYKLVTEPSGTYIYKSAQRALEVEKAAAAAARGQGGSTVSRTKP